MTAGVSQCTRTYGRLHRCGGGGSRACRQGRWAFGVLLLAVLGGCQLAVDLADRDVYRLIESRQQRALGETRQTRLPREDYPAWKVPPASQPDFRYETSPHPVTPELPAAFVATSLPAGTQPAELPDPDQLSADREDRPEALADIPAGELMSLEEAIRYAFTHSREFQSAKEDLYLAALALSLERHLWTPQLTGQISSQYANYGEIRNFDHAMDAVARVAVEQRLPLGGQVTARMIGMFMRDLTHHVTTGETGEVVLGANIPLLRGAGRVAYESRYQAERNLIYAVRTFEQFRRVLSVQIASDYFTLQQLKQEIINVTESIRSFTLEAERARALNRTGRLLELESQRAEQNRLLAINRRVDALERYQSALDRFKVRIGMPMERKIDVVLRSDESAAGSSSGPLEQVRSIEDALVMPQVSEEEAIEVGLRYRLDLLNDLDRIDDARRGVDIAENNLLPDLRALGTVRIQTVPERLNMLRYDQDRSEWRGQLVLDLPLDRFKERNSLRTALIEQRRAERRYQEARDLVAAQIRRARRRVLQQQESLRIQELSRDLALKRRAGARIRFNQGRVSNREVVDAENDLLDARNRLATAQAELRAAILEFRRDTGTLQLDDEGLWARPVSSPVATRPAG